MVYAHIYYAIHIYIHCIVIHLSQKEIAKLVDGGRYDTTDDFTVVVQPFMIGMHLPKLVSEEDPNHLPLLINTLQLTQPGGDKPDKSYLAPDCFHFSAKGHTEGALGLWNNMVIAQSTLELMANFHCICTYPYIRLSVWAPKILVGNQEQFSNVLQR